MAHERLKKIQQNYVELILNHFADERRDFHNSGLIWSDYLRSKSLTSADLLVPGKQSWQRVYDKKIVSMLDDVTRFWTENEPVLMQSLTSQHYLGVCLWGEMGIDELMPKYGLYFDTITVPDPGAFATDPSTVENIEGYAKQFFTWTAIVESLKPAVHADLDWPMIIFYPQQYCPRSVEDAESINSMKKQSDHLAGEFLRNIFHLSDKFDNPDDFFGILSHIPLDEINATFDSQKLSTMAKSMLNMPMPRTSEFGYGKNLLHRLSSRTLGRLDLLRVFFVCEGLFYLLITREENSRLVGADNSVSEAFAPALLQRNEIIGNEMKAHLDLDEESVVSYSFLKRFKWLSNVSIEDCVRLREKGEFQEIRDLFRIERHKLKHSTIDDYERLSVDLEKSITDALERIIQDAEASIVQIRKQTRNAGISFGTSLGLGLASLAVPALLPLAITSAAFTTIIGGASLKNIIDQHLTNKRKIAELGERPISFILNAYQQQNAED